MVLYIQLRGSASNRPKALHPPNAVACGMTFPLRHGGQDLLHPEVQNLGSNIIGKRFQRIGYIYGIAGREAIPRTMAPTA